MILLTYHLLHQIRGVRLAEGVLLDPASSACYTGFSCFLADYEVLRYLSKVVLVLLYLFLTSTIVFNLKAISLHPFSFVDLVLKREKGQDPGESIA